MSDRSTEPKTRAERINAFLGRHRKAFLFGSAGILGAIVIAVVVAQVLNARAADAVLAAEEVQDLWTQYQEEIAADAPTGDAEAGENDTDTDDAAAATEDALRAAIDNTLDRYPRTYGALRSRFILAELEWSKEDFQAAYDAYLAVANEHDTNHLTAPAIMSAAAAAERLDDSDQARELYGRIASGEATPNAEVARALFNLGRLAEAAGEPDLALEYYNRLADEYGDSNWTNLGRNRIIWLTTQGTGTDG